MAQLMDFTSQPSFEADQSLLSPDIRPQVGAKPPRRGFLHDHLFVRMRNFFSAASRLATRRMLDFFGLMALAPVVYCQTIDQQSGVVGVVPAVLIIFQALYFGAATGLRRSHDKWRHHSNEKRVLGLFIFIVVGSLAQTVILFAQKKEDGWASAIVTGGPLPILATAVVFMLYPIGFDKMRKRYRRKATKWDTMSGSSIPIDILCNTPWKWGAYIAANLVSFGIAGFAYHKTKNLYPLLLSLSLPILTIFLGAGLALPYRIEQIQAECRGHVHDAIVVPIIGFSRDASVIVLTYRKFKNKRTVRLERLASILDHTRFSMEDSDVIRNTFLKKFTSTDDEVVQEFINDARSVIQVVRNIGDWFTLSEDFLEDKVWIRQFLASEKGFNGYNTVQYCWNRAILESAIRVGCSEHEAQYDGPHPMDVSSTMQLFKEVADKPVSAGDKEVDIDIRDIDQVAFSRDQVKRMMQVVTDHISAFVVAALLLDRMAFSKDARSMQIVTLGKGYDIVVTAERASSDSTRTDDQKSGANPGSSSGNSAGKCHNAGPQKDAGPSNGAQAASDTIVNIDIDSICVVEHSTDFALDDQRLHGKDVDKSAPDRIAEICQENYEYANKPAYERMCGDHVPMNFTSFYLHRQHSMMFLFLYMGFAIVFIVFGQR